MRPAAYGIVEHGGELLLVNTKSTGKWFFPGGAIESGELSKDALKREIYEETGIEIEIGELFKVHESFFYYDPWEKGFQNISLIYICQPKTFETSDAHNEERDEAEKAQWINMGDLQPEQFQDFAGDIFQEFLGKKSGTK
ncbi:MAG: NUDIX domain-containing protein [Acidobacteriota bacterium]